MANQKNCGRKLTSASRRRLRRPTAFGGSGGSSLYKFFKFLPHSVIASLNFSSPPQTGASFCSCISERAAARVYSTSFVSRVTRSLAKRRFCRRIGEKACGRPDRTATGREASGGQRKKKMRTPQSVSQDLFVERGLMSKFFVEDWISVVAALVQNVPLHNK